MKKFIPIYAKGKLLARKVKVCESIFSRTRGLMFHPKLNSGEGIILVAQGQSTAQTSIHSFFVFFSFDALWLNEQKQVVDKKTVQPFHMLITPQSPAKYVLELSKGMAEGIPLGAKIDF